MNLRKIYRVTTFVPPEHLEALLEGIASVVPLKYGQYDQAAWWSAVGVEQYRPLPGAKPTSGTIGTVERVPTIRLEFAIPRDPAQLTQLIAKGLRPNHPWQEPAIFIDETEVALTDDAVVPGGI